MELLNYLGFDPGAAARARREARKARKESRIEPKPPLRPLLIPRPRRLSDAGDTNPQLQSLLIARLPVELRLMIWTYALGRESDDDVLHLDLGDGTLRYCRCSEEQPDKLSWRHQCWKTVWTKEERDQLVGGQNVPSEGPRKIRSLLLTCRLTYSETIDILYESNTFDFRRSDSLLVLPSILLPHRFQNIRRLQFSTAFQCPLPPRFSRDPRPLSSIDYLPPDDFSKWTKVCHVLASLEHLEDLQVTLSFRSPIPHRPQSNENSIFVVLEPLKGVRAASFDVILTENVSELFRDRLGPMPFRLLRRRRLGIGFSAQAADD